MADYFNNPMPTSGAHFVENPAKVTVERIARAIEYDADLAAKYNSGNFFNDIGNVRRAFELSRSFRDGTGAEVRKAKAKAQRPVAEGGMGLKRGTPAFDEVVLKAHGGTLPDKQTNVGEGGRKAIAAAIGRARGYVKTNIRNRGRYLGVYGPVAGLKLGAIQSRKWGSNKGIPKWKVGKDGSINGKVFGRNREGGSLMKFKAGASSESAFKKATLSAIRTTYASQIKDAGGRWWDVPAAKSAYESAVKGRRHSEPLTAAQSNERMYARFGGKSSYSEQTAGMAASRSRSGSTRVTSAMSSRPGSARAFNAEERAALQRRFGKTRAADVGEAAAAGAAAGFEAGVEAGVVLAAPKTKRIRKKKGETTVSENPFHSLGYDEMGDLALSNPTGIGLLDGIENSVGNLPVIGPVLAPIIAPAALGAAAAAVHIILVPRLEGYLPAWAQPYSYTIGGAAVGIVSGVVAAKSSDGTVRTAAGLIGGAAVAIGLGIDAYRMFVAKGGATAGDDDMAGLALSGDDDMGDLALSGDEMGDLALSGLGVMGAVALGGDRAAFGDGGAYQVQSLGFAGDHSALHAMYADAAMADAYFSGPDLDGVEGEAALAGPSSFMGTFGAAPVRAAGQKRMQSRHAGLRGHRWGWLIKMVGYENFQKITALDPEQRVNVIKQLREQAMASVQRYVDESKAAQLASKPVTAPAELSGYGYGATMFSGGSY